MLIYLFLIIKYIRKYNNVSIKFDLETVFSNSIWLYTLIVHVIYVIYINFCNTNLQILDFIWVVIAQMLCMLQPTIQHLVKKKFLLL